MPLDLDLYRSVGLGNLLGGLPVVGRTGAAPLTKAVVQRYVSVLVAEDRSPASVNQRLSAIRKLVREAADNGLLGTFEAESIARVKGIKKQGRLAQPRPGPGSPAGAGHARV